MKLVVCCPPALGELVHARSRGWVERQQAEVVTEGPKGGATLQGDVQLILTPDLPRWADADAVTRLPDAITADGRKFEWRRLLPEYRERLLKWNAEPFAVPLVGEAPVCVYRSDLYADAATRAKYRAFQERRNQTRAEQKLPPAPVRDLRAPPTWEEFALQAEFFTEHTKQPSLPPLPQDEAELDRQFYAVAACYARRAVPSDEKTGKDHLDETFSFHFDQRTGDARIADPGFVEALALLRRLQRCRPAGTSPRPEEAFGQGKAVLCLTEAPSLVEFQRRPALRDRFGVCQIPGSDRYYGAARHWVALQETVNRVPYLGAASWLAVVPASSQQQEAAFDLLDEMAGPASSRQTALEPGWGGPTRSEHLLRDRWDSYDLDAVRTASLKETLTRTLLEHKIRNPVISLRTPSRREYRAALIEAGLRPALLGDEPPEKALAEVKRRWDALIAKRGKAEHLRDYRLSVGLLGR